MAKFRDFQPGTRLTGLPMTETTEPTSIEQEREMVMLEVWGSTTYPPESWERWGAAVTDYAPEWLTESDLDGAEPDSCVTVLDYSLTEPEAPEGWKRVYQYAAGEKVCPYCGDGTGEESRRPECKLCEGDGLLYEGEECQVVVFAPLLYTYGSGMVGCLYDSGPHFADTLEDAIEGALEIFSDLGKLSLDRARRDLTERKIHYFDRRIRPFAGADYVEISGPS